jgi:hypothetical protein
MKRKMKHKQKIILSAGAAVVIVILALGVFLAASNRKNAAQKHTDLLISEINAGSLSVTKSSTDCMNTGNGVVKTVFRHRQCVATKTDYYSADNLDNIKKSIYSSTIAKGWMVLDNGSLDGSRFSSDNYLEASMNRDKLASNLTVHVLLIDKVDTLSELSSSEISQFKSAASKSTYVIVVNISTAFEG